MSLVASRVGPSLAYLHQWGDLPQEVKVVLWPADGRAVAPAKIHLPQRLIRLRLPFPSASERLPLLRGGLAPGRPLVDIFVPVVNRR
jgi:hypothetical protein